MYTLIDGKIRFTPLDNPMTKIICTCDVFTISIDAVTYHVHESKKHKNVASDVLCPSCSEILPIQKKSMIVRRCMCDVQYLLGIASVGIDEA